MTWTPLMCITVIAITFVIGEYLSRATKGYVSSMVFACFIAMILFWTGSVPSDIAASSTLLTTLGACGTAFLLVNMGSSIDVESLISEWKTVVVCIVGLVGLGILAFTVGAMVFGKDYSLTAAPVVAGGLIAYQIVGGVAVEAGRPELQGYAALVMAFQSMIGMPVASFCLKNELKKQKRDGKLTEEYQASKKGLKLPETNIFPTVKETNNTSTMKFAKLGIVAVISYMLSTYVVPAINVNIMYLLMGVLFRKINFLDKSPLTSAGGYGYVMLCMFCSSTALQLFHFKTLSACLHLSSVCLLSALSVLQSVLLSQARLSVTIYSYLSLAVLRLCSVTRVPKSFQKKFVHLWMTLQNLKKYMLWTM